MEGYQDIEKMVDDRLADAATDVRTAIATRAIFRTLPLLMLYSETLRNSPTPVEAFGFWPEEHRKTYLLAFMQTYSVIALLAQRELPVKHLALSSYELCLPIVEIFESSWAYIEGESYAEQEYFAGRTSTYKGLVLSLRSIRKIFKSLPPLLRPIYNEFVDVKREAEALEPVTRLAAQLATLYSEAASSARQFSSEGDFTSAIIAAAKDHSAQLVKRFTFFSETASTVAISLDQSQPLIIFSSAAKAAAEAFVAVGRELELGNLDAFASALTVAMARTEIYEAARIGTIPFYDHIAVDFFLAPDTEKYKAVQLSCREDFAAGIKAALSHIAICAERAAEACQTAAIDSDSYESAIIAFEGFASACDAIDQRIFSTASFNFIFIQSRNLVWDFYTHQEALQCLRCLNDASFNKDICDASSKVIAATKTAYCAHDLPDLDYCFSQSLLADLDFISEFSCSELSAQKIWITPVATADIGAELERRLPIGLAIWQELWANFQRDALAIAPEAQSWLDWCNKVFAGDPAPEQPMQELLKYSCAAPKPAHDATMVATKDDVSAALIL